MPLRARALRRLGFLAPDPVEPVGVSGSARPLARGEAFTLGVWNLQYGASRRPHFFYDGGRDVFVDVPTVRRTLAAMAERLGTWDIALVQELDRGSDRTGRVDELPLLGPWPTVATTCYHRAPWVPSPAHRPLGRVDFHLATLARYAQAGGERHALPAMNEPALRRLFNLRRAMLVTRLPLDGGGALTLANVHLSAFTHGDDTVARQVAVLARWMAAQRGPWLLAGDFNALPPDADPARVGEPADPAMRTLLPRFRSLVDVRRPTYQPWGGAPDRTYDYVFGSPDLEVLDADVPACDESDHLPVVLRLRVPATTTSSATPPEGSGAVAQPGVAVAAPG